MTTYVYRAIVVGRPDDVIAVAERHGLRLMDNPERYGEGHSSVMAHSTSEQLGAWWAEGWGQHWEPGTLAWYSEPARIDET